MWKSLFLKRFFSAVSFFRKLFFTVFFLETGMWKSLFLKLIFLPCICFFRKRFFAVFDFFGLETRRLVFLLCFFIVVGWGDVDDSCRDFLGVDR